MKRGITIESAYDYHDNDVVIIKKSRGKLTLTEIEDLLRYEDHQRWCNHYAILLNCSEASIGGAGYFDEDEPKGDAVRLYPIEEGEFCPVCGNYVPPFRYCPTCGTSWEDAGKNIETLLESMKEESVREIRRCGSYASKTAWYWSYIGALDMARQLRLITEERRQELTDSFKTYKPSPERAGNDAPTT